MKAVVAMAAVLVCFLGLCVSGVEFTRVVEAVAVTQQSCDGGGVDSQPGTSRDAEEAIPKHMLDLYITMGKRYGLAWSILAGIGFVESRHGRDPRTSSAGARGPMQFIPTTWAIYGVDGDGDGDRDIMDPADAVASAANYLRASGAPQNWEKAIWHYNQSHEYYLNVMRMAEKYAAGGYAIDTSACAPGECPTADATATGTLGQRIAACALAEAANPAHNRERGGDNCNFYTAAFGLGHRECSSGWRNEPWCADFTKWVWKQAGADTDGTDPGAISFMHYGQRRGTWHTGNPQLGDAIYFSFGHVGVVTNVSDPRQVSYVSGNTTNPAHANNTDAVLEKRVPRSWGAIVGYATAVSKARSKA